MKQFLLILLSVSLAATVNSQSILDKVKKKLNTNSGVTEEEAGRGVKEALNNGIGSAVSFLNKPDAFFKSELYKVLLPPDAKKMEKTLRDMGMGKMCDDAIEAINRGAEDASSHILPIPISRKVFSIFFASGGNKTL